MGDEGGAARGFVSCCKVLETSSPRKREWGAPDGGCPERTFLGAPWPLLGGSVAEVAPAQARVGGGPG